MLIKRISMNLQRSLPIVINQAQRGISFTACQQIIKVHRFCDGAWIAKIQIRLNRDWGSIRHRILEGVLLVAGDLQKGFAMPHEIGMKAKTSRESDFISTLQQDFPDKIAVFKPKTKFRRKAKGEV